MVTTEDKPEEVDLYEPLDLEQAMKFFYAILNKYGGKNNKVTMSAKEFDDMPKDWADRMQFKKIKKTGQVEASLKPRRKRKQVKLIKQKAKKLILPPGFRDN